jgi:hypothetical protein
VVCAPESAVVREVQVPLQVDALAATVRRAVGGDGMVGKATDVNQGDLLADKDTIFSKVVH